jgi:RsiW-degrading membrane proteinase PrsW (M82 family)
MELIIGLILSIAAAIVPIAIYSLLLWWADRYEREPFWLLLVAFLWGAIPAVILTILTNISGDLAVDHFAVEWFAYCVEAPIIEEVAKGLALLGLFVFHRKQFDGILDGLVYGALVGFGFSMTEDFIYYLSALGEGGLAGLLPVLFLRSIFFALNHSVYTGLVGMGFGLATVSRSKAQRWLWPLLGLGLAICAHSIHNFGALLAERAGEEHAALAIFGLLLSLSFAAAGLILIVGVVLSAWQLQRRIIREELSLLVGQLLTSAELDNLCSRWTQPVFCGKAATRRNSKLVQLALRQRRLKVAGAANEPQLVAETGKLHHELTLKYRAGA